MSYTKSITRRVYLASRGDIYTPAGGHTVADPSGTATFSANISGDAVPNFAEKIRKKVDASSVYSRRDMRILKLKPHVQSASNVGGDTTTWSFGWHNAGHPPTTVVALNYDEADELALRSFYKQLAKSMEQFQALPFLKEIAQTKRLLGETSLRLFNHFYNRGGQLGAYARKLKRQGRPWRLASQDLSKRWIEYQFGLQPLISDVAGLSEACREPGYPSLVIKGRSPELIVSKINISGPISYHSCSARYAGFRRSSVRVRYTAGYNISPSLGDRLGLSLNSIPGAVWEITPWSFLVDYFVDISGFITSQTYASLPLVYCTKSQQTRILGMFSTGPVDASSSALRWQRYSSFGNLHWECTNYLRQPLSGMPFYMPSVKISDGMSWGHNSNISALLGMRIKSW